MNPTALKAALAGVIALLGAGTAGANGLDLSHLDLGQWISALGTGLVAGGALLHNPKGKEAAAVDDLLKKAADAKDDLTKQALDGIDKAKKAVADLVAALPADAEKAVEKAVPGIDAIIVDRRNA